MKSRLAVSFGEVADREGGIQDKRRPCTWAKGRPGVPRSVDFRAWSSRSRTRAKGCPGVPGPADFRAWSRRSLTRAKVLPGVPGSADFRAWSRWGHWAGPVG